MSTAASATRPTPCWKSAWRRSKAAAARSRASGQAALHLAVATLAGAGSTCGQLVGAVRRQPQPAAYTLARFGIRTSFVKPADIDGWRAAIRPDTKLLFGETLGNPGLDVLDIPP
jgi:O-acetylhomoserine (thiol)-lyase